MEINFWAINFHVVYFDGCKFCHISLECLFEYGYILLISLKVIFVVARYVIFIFSMITVGKINCCKITENVPIE